MDNGFSIGCITSPSCPLWFFQPGDPESVWYTCVNDDVGDYWAEWTPSITIAGNYEVFVNIPPYPELAKANPRYTIHYLDGSTTNTVLLDQPTTAENYMISLGTYYFEAESNAMLRVTNATGETNPTTCTGNPQEDILLVAETAAFLQVLPSPSAQTFMPRILKGDSQILGPYPPPATPTTSAYP